MKKAEGRRQKALSARRGAGGDVSRRFAARAVCALLLLAAAFCLLPSAFRLPPSVFAQAPAGEAGDEIVVEGRRAGDVFGVGRTVRVRGEVRGVIAFGGDVVVEGRVEGDAAAVGGSVIQRPGSYIGGDVMVFGGAYRDEAGAEGRSHSGRTIMFAGYEQELRELAQNPASVLTPRLTLSFVGWRLLAVLFWFVVSLALTAATPGAVSRAAARLQMSSLRVAVIGVVGALVVGPGAAAALRFLPPMVGGLVFAMAMLLLLVSYLFGRVVVNVVTGSWLQRVLLPEGRRSETTALLLGAAFWAVALALPYVWPACVLGLVVVSLGLALTARYRLHWKRG